MESPRALYPAHHSYGAHAPWSPRTTTRERKTCRPQLERSPHAAATTDPTCLKEDPMRRN